MKTYFHNGVRNYQFIKIDKLNNQTAEETILQNPDLFLRQSDHFKIQSILKGANLNPQNLSDIQLFYNSVLNNHYNQF